jgi:2-hydroxycyclohexanecarboxyl-CoA dehydrogenase
MSAPVVLITGAGSGIGAAVATRMRSAGWQVASISREPAPDNDFWDIADVADEDAVRAAVESAVAALGRIDAAVVSAGHYEERPALEIDRSSWDRMLRVHVGGLAHVLRAVLPDMRARGAGRIVGIASERAIGGGDNDAHYASAKAAALSLLRSVAVEVAKDGVLVNAVAPGPCDTPLLPADSWERDRAFVEKLPAGRIADPDEVAEMVRTLLEDDVFMCGEVLSVNSGTVI